MEPEKVQSLALDRDLKALTHESPALDRDLETLTSAPFPLYKGSLLPLLGLNSPWPVGIVTSWPFGEDGS